MRPIGTFLTEDLLKVNVRYKKTPLNLATVLLLPRKCLQLPQDLAKKGNTMSNKEQQFNFGFGISDFSINSRFGVFTIFLKL